MKIILTFSLLIFNLSTFSQALFFNEHKVIDFNVPRSSESYESRIIRLNGQDTLIRRLDYPIGLDWNPISENEIIGCNVWACGKLNLTTGEFDTLYHNRGLEIMEISCNDHSCFILTTPFETERFDVYKLFRINISNKEIEEVNLSGHFKILNIYSSNKYLSFIDYNYDEEKDFVLGKLIIYNTETNEYIQIDEANSNNNEWFGGVNDGTVMCWNDDTDLYFLKKDPNKVRGTIFKYNVKSKLKTRAFELPYERIKSFALKDNGIIIEHDDKLIFLDNKGNQKLIYQVGYKYDYILDQLYAR